MIVPDVDLLVYAYNTGAPRYLCASAGVQVEMRLVHIFEMRDGLISREIGYEMWRPAD